ncbi:MAG: chorismate synthase [Alphaproteobacteria bacterium]|nr:chorismate synthase [Alphaproteobacteria bacterium]
MSFSFGENIRITLFGQSHAEAIGVIIDGLPAGISFDTDAIQAFMARRAPGKSPLATARKEDDIPKILSGMKNGKTCGAPICAIIENHDVKSGDYNPDIPRPSHADYPAFVKYKGAFDYRGGGHFSGRMTASLCFAGALCLQILARKGIKIAAHIASIASVNDTLFNPLEPENVNKDFPVINPEAGLKMQDLILDTAKDGDSLGGVIECAVTGMPAGVGEPIFGGLENVIASAMFAIPAVKGIEFGAGFAAALMKGSENNDAYYFAGQNIKTRTNNHGGILGGLSSGMPIIFRTAIKPTPSIAKPQESVNLATGEATELIIKGRHDPCIVPRAVPCVEAVTAIALTDILANEVQL